MVVFHPMIVCGPVSTITDFAIDVDVNIYWYVLAKGISAFTALYLIFCHSTGIQRSFGLL